MLIGVDGRESAFRDHDQVDEVIKIVITGNTVHQIDRAAQVAGLTSAQWLRTVIGQALIDSEEPGGPPLDTWSMYAVEPDAIVS